MSNVIGPFLVGVLVSFALGWMAASSTIVKECRTLGGFYVSSSVFECREVKDGT